MLWTIVLALLIVFVGLPLAVTLLFSRAFWTAVFVFGCASVLLYSCVNYTSAPPRPRKIPRAETLARYEEWERRRTEAAPAAPER